VNYRKVEDHLRQALTHLMLADAAETVCGLPDTPHQAWRAGMLCECLTNAVDEVRSLATRAQALADSQAQDGVS
jgi:hypothetical protein